ncbi:type II toxin-antitoxin system RelE/ParE family toxin [Novosphingobium sp. NDB2Meth1]|uniref:type II toxin-antitoxin system RelE/ParE family toxin n=1 Tax=Novosphingobium sp. NDB2Meth1 TaxID=1892847 RepID=UPI0015598445|nr:type II toxin-antitoxin system RelE/ParE family toxin [Novosphingobium sp. NDB2Meth1]
MIFAEAAKRDLDDIVTFIALEDRVAAEAVARAIVEAARRLTSFPGLGHAGRLQGTREYSVSRLPYIIVYTADAQAVSVLAVLHTARNLPRALAARRREIDD